MGKEGVVRGKCALRRSLITRRARLRFLSLLRVGAE